jgi:prepilin-type N-terminal cleavage/methylation domain-containing protein
MRQNHGFTLIEVLVSVALTGMILLAGYSAFQRIMLAQATLGAAIDVQKNLFYTNEKLTTLIREGGTIDYEEYFNRRMLGYARSMVDTSIDTETTNTDTYTFTNFSHFGNGNVAIKPPIYFCGVFG